MDVNDALELLYGSRASDLTAQGYYEALQRIRSWDQSLAKRIERVLDPVLKEQFFPRRKREWYWTSEGTEARVTLLPGNPHFHADVDTVRELLYIPRGYIHATPAHPLWKHLQDIMKLHELNSKRMRRIVESNLAGEWLNIHRMTAAGRMAEAGGSELLSPKMRESAMSSAGVDLRTGDVPKWLRHPGDALEAQKVMEAPIDWATSHLIKRHYLPSHASHAMAMFILTQDNSWFAGLGHLDISITLNNDPSTDPEAFSVSIRNIDEFTSKDEWDTVWRNYVKPRQEFIWEKRGMRPHGRRTRDIERLKKALPFYRKMVEKKVDFKTLYLSEEGAAEAETLEFEREDLQKTIRQLKRLLKPIP
jgi:hypothetical protein